MGSTRIVREPSLGGGTHVFEVDEDGGVVAEWFEHPDWIEPEYWASLAASPGHHHTTAPELGQAF